MGGRQCEVILELPDGQRYSVMIEAESLCHAAVLFYSHCASPPAGATPPRIELDAVLEVQPVYQVSLNKAMAWANEQAEKQHVKRKS